MEGAVLLCLNIGFARRIVDKPAVPTAAAIRGWCSPLLFVQCAGGRSKDVHIPGGSPFRVKKSPLERAILSRWWELGLVVRRERLGRTWGHSNLSYQS